MKIIVYFLVGIFGFIGFITSVVGVGKFEADKAIPALLIGGLLGVIYFIPSFVAISRRHQNEVAIVVLNAVAGWTFLGWVGSLVWSLIASKNSRNSESDN